MGEFSVNPKRLDPYKNFKFKLSWDGHYVAGISKVGALKRTTETIKHRNGGSPSTSLKSPGRSEYSLPSSVSRTPPSSTYRPSVVF